MGVIQSPKIVTSNLVFHYDMGNTAKSWKGKPTTNVVPVDLSTYTVDNGCTVVATGEYYQGQPVYRATFPSGTLPRFRWDFPYTTGQTFTGSVYYKFISGNQSNPALVFRESGFGTEYASSTFGYTTEWTKKEITYTFSASGTSMFLFYRSNSSTTIPIVIDFAMPQCEENSFSTPYVNSTRLSNYNLDGVPNATVWNQSASSADTAGNLTFTNGSYSSKGTWDLYRQYTGLTNGKSYTWSALVKLGTATNFLVTINNTLAWNTGPSAIFDTKSLSTSKWTRVKLSSTADSSGKFNLHLGATNNNAQSGTVRSADLNTVQTAGTVFIKDVRLYRDDSEPAIYDLTDINDITASSLTYNSNNTFTFNGTNYLEVPDSPDIRPASGYITTIVWFKQNAVGSLNNSILINKENEYEISSGGGSVTYAFRPNWAWVGSGFSIAVGETACVAITYDQANQRMYKNGVQVYSAALTGAIGNVYANALRIGARGAPGAASSFNTADIYSVQIYDRALTADEVRQNFNAYKGRFGL